MSSEKIISDLDNSLPYGISNHLGVYHAMDPDVREDPTSTSVRYAPHREEMAQSIEDSNQFEIVGPR